LQYPANDAAAVAEALTKLKFKVLLKRNIGNEEFRVALREIAKESIGAYLGVVYFSGHGVEVNGRNYLIPVDAMLSRASDIDLEAIPLDTILNQLPGVYKLKLVILDACRDYAFSLAGDKRSLRRGLARIEPEDNTLVVYAARDGTTADDGLGRKHSPFTEALLKHLGTPGLELRFLLGEVRDDVMTITNRAQQPHVYGTLGPQAIYLAPPTK
jgi:uncharacterized caspase-like protein